MLIPKSLDKHGNRNWKVTTQPDLEPVTVDEVKTFGRIDGDEEDDVIESGIKMAREASELLLGRSFIEQTITLVMDFWPSEVIKLPRPPLIAITGVYTTDEDDSDTEYDSDYYLVDTVAEPGKLIIKQDYTPPTNTDRSYSGFKIIYTAGYGDEVTDVPEILRNAIKMWTIDYFETRKFDPKNPPAQVKTLLGLKEIPRI